MAWRDLLGRRDSKDSDLVSASCFGAVPGAKSAAGVGGALG